VVSIMCNLNISVQETETHDDEGSTHLWNVGPLQRYCTALHPTRLYKLHICCRENREIPHINSVRNLPPYFLNSNFNDNMLPSKNRSSKMSLSFRLYNSNSVCTRISQLSHACHTHRPPLLDMINLIKFSGESNYETPHCKTSPSSF
jgi:hypothetical protein